MKFKIQRYDLYLEDHPNTKAYNHKTVAIEYGYDLAKSWLHDFKNSNHGLTIIDDCIDSEGYIDFQGTEHDMESITYEIIEV